MAAPRQFPGWVCLGLEGVVLQKGDSWVNEGTQGYEQPGLAANAVDLIPERVGQLATRITTNFGWSVYRRVGPKWVQITDRDPLCDDRPLRVVADEGAALS